ncbi:MAG: hypothetical protein LBQ66_09915 [Planctomycetaceae bacterium]|nr:hypothetical protein [Planctomycetaceae bacterium]
MPIRFGVQFQLVRFYYAQRRAGRPRSSPSPLRGKLVWYNEGISPAFQSAPLRGNCRINADAIHQESSAVGCPPYVYQHVLAFRSLTYAIRQ